MRGAPFHPGGWYKNTYVQLDCLVAALWVCGYKYNDQTACVHPSCPFFLDAHMPTSETTENQPIEQMVQLLAPPLSEAHFGLMWSAFAIKKNIEVDDGDLMIDDRQIVLAQLHFAVADLGGSAMVTENDAWSLIGGRMGWIDFHFPEGPHCSPSVATRLQCVYDRYLAAFDQVYQQLWYMNAQRRSQLQDMFPVEQRHPLSSVIPSNEDQQSEYQYSAQQQHSQQQSPFQTSLSIPLGPDNIPVAIAPMPEALFKATSAQDQIGMAQNYHTYDDTSQLQTSSFAHDLAHALDQQHFGTQMFVVNDIWSPCFSASPLHAMCSMDMDGLDQTGTLGQNAEVIGTSYSGPSVAGTEAGHCPIQQRPIRLHPENARKEIKRARQEWSNEDVFSTYPDIPFTPAGPQNPAYPETYQRLLTLAYQADLNLPKIICLVLAQQVEQVLQNVVMMTSLTWHQRQQAVHNRYILDLYKMRSFIQYLTYIIVGAEMQPKSIQNEAQFSHAQQSPTSPPPSIPAPPTVSKTLKEGRKGTPSVVQTSSAAAARALEPSPIPPSVLSVLSSFNSPPVSALSSWQKCDRRLKTINTTPPAPTLPSKSLAAIAAPLQIALTPNASISTSLFENNKKRPREEEAIFATETSTSLMLSPKRSKSESVEQIADGIRPEANEDSVLRSMFDSYIEIPVTAPPAPDSITTTTASFVQGTDMRVGTGIACIGEVWGYYPLRTYSEGQ
ncbi:hypothetical protein OF83DRAFT_1144876 [Amylostereum chailletii]|nr:hypothetical protein OF83DRAFT_1144876 [Amylostereum chailletii]